MVSIRRIFPENLIELEKVVHILEENGLYYENIVTEIYGVYDSNELIATGSIYQNVLKMIAVTKAYQGTSTINQLVSALLMRSNELELNHLFLYTKPEMTSKFKYLGFTEVASTKSVALMENVKNGIQNYLEQLSLESHMTQGQISSIVVNCNPFTLGHQYLIEKACENSDWLHVFILWEDNSYFPSKVRYDLVKKGTSHLNNVTLHWAKDYIISNATFPGYFLGEEENVIKAQAQLDCEIFGRYIAKRLNISKRFIGQEPFNKITALYNKVLLSDLSALGIEVVEIERKAIEEEIVSASKVRKFISENNWTALKKLVPDTTYDFLISEEASPIIERIKGTYHINQYV